jgi:hypothetical protein
MVFANIPASYADSLKGDRFVALDKLFIMTAKTTPYPSCHLDNIQAKATRKMAGWLRRVTLTNYTAGPLARKWRPRNDKRSFCSQMKALPLKIQ